MNPKKKKQKTKKEYEKYIKKLILKYQKILLIDRSIFTIEYDEDGDKEDAYMHISVNYPYINPKIYYSDSSYKDWCNNKDMTPYIIHEMVHTIVEPLNEKAKQRFVSQDEILHECERLTDWITNIIVKNNISNEENPRKTKKGNARR